MVQTNRSKAIILCSVAAVGVLIGYAVWTRTAGSSHVTTEVAPTVIRGTPEIDEAIATASIRFGLGPGQKIDAWVEPNCNAVVLFSTSTKESYWVWYDLKTKSITGRLTWTAARSVVEDAASFEPANALSDFEQTGPGERPRYLIGTMSEKNQTQYLRLQTEACTLSHGVLEHSQDGQRFEVETDLQFASGNAGDYAPERTPEVSRRTDLTRKVSAEALKQSGVRSPAYDVWEEPDCNGVVAFVRDPAPNGPVVWYWYDVASQRITESLTADALEQALRNLREGVTLRRPAWNALFDGPNARPRYYMADVKNGDMIWVHLESQKCGLSHVQAQITRFPDMTGEFVPLGVTSTVQ
jgi:hypothetical protein